MIHFQGVGTVEVLLLYLNFANVILLGNKWHHDPEITRCLTLDRLTIKYVVNMFVYILSTVTKSGLRPVRT